MFKKNTDYISMLKNGVQGGKGEVKIEPLWLPNDELKSNIKFLARVTIPQGASIGFHQHDNEEEIYYILSGEGVAKDNNDEHKVCVGDSILTRCGEKHSISCTSKEPLVMTATIVTYN
ncbi:cupin domain-containing protein [Lentisphaerota bacterium WC36G]|nr:cupin domain-containing protein [Lentisphaerae bacterium WC36]